MTTRRIVPQPPPSGNPDLDRWMFSLWQGLLDAGVVTWDKIDLTGSDLSEIGGQLNPGSAAALKRYAANNG